MLRDGELVTVDARQGRRAGGRRRAARAAGGPPARRRPVTATRLLVNLSEPSQVDRAAALDVDGVGLLRAELMILEALEGTHPRRLLEEGRGDEFVERMAEALTAFAAGVRAAADHLPHDRLPHERVPRAGGRRAVRAEEANPMIGYRGALRYVREPDLLRLELDAVGRVCDAGYENLHVMLPFVRTARELAPAARSSRRPGCSTGAGFELWVMAEVPSVLFNLERYAELGVAGISIGSNDLTQLVLGADRDSEVLAEVFDERDPAVSPTSRADPARPRARPADLDLRPGAIGAPGVRRAARSRRHRRDLGERGRRRPHPGLDRRALGPRQIIRHFGGPTCTASSSGAWLTATAARARPARRAAGAEGLVMHARSGSHPSQLRSAHTPDLRA